jgi:hypothetical protein
VNTDAMPADRRLPEASTSILAEARFIKTHQQKLVNLAGHPNREITNYLSTISQRPLLHRHTTLN